jgi:hypothetical protein
LSLIFEKRGALDFHLGAAMFTLTGNFIFAGGAGVRRKVRLVREASAGISRMAIASPLTAQSKGLISSQKVRNRFGLQNGIKFFSTAKVGELSKDRVWLAKMTQTISYHWHRQNSRKKSESLNDSLMGPGFHFLRMRPTSPFPAGDSSRVGKSNVMALTHPTTSRGARIARG